VQATVLTKPLDYEEKATRLKRQILLLKEDLKWVKHTGVKRAIENDISQKQTGLRLITEKAKRPAP